MHDASSLIQLFSGMQVHAHGMIIHVNEILSHHPALAERLQVVERASEQELGKLLLRRAAEDLGKVISFTSTKLEELGKAPLTPEDLEKIPLSTGDAFIRESRYVEDPFLIDCWANLLASYVECAREGSEIRRYYSVVLGQLSPNDAKCLHSIYAIDTSRDPSGPTISELAGWEEASFREPRGNDIYSGMPISTVLLPDKAFIYKEALRADRPEMDKELAGDVLASISNLSRLGLVDRSAYMDGGSDPRIVFHTGFGLLFAKSIISVSAR